MVQKRSKQIKITILIILIIALTAGGVVWFINSRSNNENNIPIQEENLDFSAKRLIVVTDVELKETYNATNVNKTNSGKYVLKYATEEDTKKAYESLKQDETIQSVDIDINVKLQEVEPLFITYTSNGLNANSWGLFTMGLDKTQNLINNSTSKNDVIVAVIDTGFDIENEYITSNNLGDRIDSRYINIMDNSKDMTDESSQTINEQTVLLGHGTHVGGIILDSTPDNVKILPIKAGGADGLPLVYVCEALRYAIDQGADVINLSLGAEKQSATIEEEFQALIEEAIQKGITVVAAAGNGDENGIRKTADNVYPVAFDDVIGVAALGTDIITTTNGSIDYENYAAAKQSNVSNLSYTSFSNYGKAVDYSAPGQYILSLTPTQSASGVCGFMSGTSQASPHIAATIATLKSYNKDITLAQVNKILEYYSLDLGTTGRDDDYGYGMPCLKNAQECTCNCDTCDKLYCFGCDCDTCLYSLTVDKELDRIEITTNPDKMEYEVGETFDKTGMVVTAIYSDASQETITEYEYAPTGELTTNDNLITISYQGKMAILSITVREETPPAEKTLQKIEITSQPNKLTYNEGEKFDPTGMIVKGIYSDNSDIILSNYDYSPKGNLTKNDTAVIITYQGKTATVNITVQEVKQEERKLERIEITSQPNKTTYTEGEKFDSTGMIITAIYSDGTREIITNYSCFPVTELKQNNNEITVSYTYNGKTVTAKYPIEVKTQTQNNSGNNNNNNNNNGGNNNSGTPIGNNNMNFITVKENDNNTSNNKTIPKSTNTDNTIKGGTIANTGLETIIIIPIAIITVIGTVAFINYKRYKDI